MTRPTSVDLLKYFLYLGSLGFGGPVALVGYMQRDLVERRQWFTKEEYMKSLALSQLAPGPLAAQLAICLGYVHSRVRGATLLTPGPIVITVAFIGYLVAAFPGAVAAAVGVFLPVYLFVVIPFPWFDRISGNPKVKGFVAGVTAAASGTIAGACFVLARRAIIDVPTLVIGATALVVAWRFKIPEPVLIAAGAIAGLVIFAMR
jgi:chromate transporter